MKLRVKTFHLAGGILRVDSRDADCVLRVFATDSSGVMRFVGKLRGRELRDLRDRLNAVLEAT